MKHARDLFHKAIAGITWPLSGIAAHRQSCRQIDQWLLPFFAFIEPSVRAGEQMMGTPEKLPVLILSQREYEALPLNEQYAHFCALGYPDDFDERYAAALKDFPKLLAIDGVADIGISWNAVELLVGTTEVVVEDTHGACRVLGHYVIHFTHAGYRIENVDTTRGAEYEYAHPHAHQDGEFCMNAAHAIAKAGIKDGLYSLPLKIFMTALHMRAGTVEVGGAFQAAHLDNWPERK